MRNAGGYAVLIPTESGRVNFDRFRCEDVVAGKPLEIDTFTCCHCGGVRHIKPKANMDDFGSMCRNCMKMTCPTCANGSCSPFMKKLEAAEKRDQALRSYGF